MQKLTFSLSSLDVHTTLKADDVRLEQPSIVLNPHNDTVIIGTEKLHARSSSIFQKTSYAAESLLMTSTHGFSALDRYPDHELIMKQWTHVHDIFPTPHLKNTQLWRSAKERIGNVAYNLWFAAAGTDCGIHNEHDFLEIHTQVWGTGHMQKFHEKDADTMYQDIFMTPGFTHAPFCGEHYHTYPWHRYFADTDCIWLAVEYYG